MLPFPGDWHLLKNYQHALMKAYFDAGLKQLAQAAGYPTGAIQSSSQFKRSHHFILEAWEALYRVMVQKYLETSGCTLECSSDPHIPTVTQSIKQVFLPARTDSTELSQVLSKVKSVLTTSSFHSKCYSFLTNLATTDSTWKFWVQFVFKDALAYVGLYLAIRSGNWDLRVASIKMIAPIFSAFDHFTYRKLIAQHIADLYNLPSEVKGYLKSGTFVVSVTGRGWHSVGIDEAHEMLINKACKTSIVHPSKDYINRVAKYIPYRTKCIENLRKQIFPEESAVVKETTPTSIFTSKSSDKKSNLNIDTQMSLLRSTTLFEATGTNHGIINPFSKKKANQNKNMICYTSEILELQNLRST